MAAFRVGELRLGIMKSLLHMFVSEFDGIQFTNPTTFLKEKNLKTIYCHKDVSLNSATKKLNKHHHLSSKILNKKVALYQGQP